MPAECTDKFDDVATALESLVTALDELAENPPAALNPKTLDDFRGAVVLASRLLRELEEQLESGGD